MNKKEYNGWFNYETWAVALWLDSEVGSQRYWGEVTQEVFDAAKPGEYEWQTKEAEAKFALSRRLKEEMEDGSPDLGATLHADLLTAAFSKVNWDEIAAHYIDNLPVVKE